VKTTAEERPSSRKVSAARITLWRSGMILSRDVVAVEKQAVPGAFSVGRRLVRLAVAPHRRYLVTISQ
jgi:hypothetical protein